MHTYHALPFTSVKNNIELAEPHTAIEKDISLNSPALTVFTDFSKTRAMTIRARTQIDVALEHMIQLGLRLLFVIDQSGHLLGLVTSHDIMGEKPMLYVQSHDGQYNALTRAHVHVQDVMQLPSEWRTLDIKAAEQAKVGDIVENFKHMHKRHIVVIEQTPSKPLVIKGIFSASRVERATGIILGTHLEPSQSFVELEQALAN